MSGAPLLCLRHPPSERRVGSSGKVTCQRCHAFPEGIEHRAPQLRDYGVDLASKAARDAREHVRAAIRAKQTDGRQLARLLAPIARFAEAIRFGRLGVGESRGRIAREALLAAAQDAPEAVAEHLVAAAAALEGVGL